MGLLMWWRGRRAPIHFEEFRQEDSEGEGLSSISLRQRHHEDWQETRFVLWLPEDDVAHVAQHEDGGRQVETSEPPIDGPASRLTTSEEEPSDLIEVT